MARVSPKSSLSPSATQGSSGIDLGKDSGVDMGRKAQPSVTSGGIGVSKEVANIGGMTVTGGVSVELSPVAISISANPSENSVSISGSAELPGGLLGISGGTTIDTSTGEITGGSVGGEIGGFGINVSSNKGQIGIEFTYQIPFSPIEISLGFGSPPKKPTPTPTPTPPSTPTQPTIPNVFKCANGEWVLGGLIKTNGRPETPEELLNAHIANWYLSICNPHMYPRPAGSDPSDNSVFRPQDPAAADRTFNGAPCTVSVQTVKNPNFYARRGSYYYYSNANLNQHLYAANDGYQAIYFKRCYVQEVYTRNDGKGVFYGSPYNPFWEIISTYPPQFCPDGKISVAVPPTSSPPAPTPIFNPFPNPPPRKENMDECCRDSVRMLRRIHKHLGVSPIAGMEPLEQLAGVKTKGETFQGDKMAFPFEVPKTWLDVLAKGSEKITVKNLAELLLVMGAQSERLERVLGTKEFLKDSEGKLRQSEGNLLSWMSGKNPDFAYPDPNDFWLNTDDGIIKEKRLEVRNLTDAIRYVVEMGNRLERILPIAELKDSSIPARWIYPNGKGQLRVGNLIHLCEYMIRKSDKDMGYWPQKITIKAANPAIKDDEPITTDVHSQADMLRVILQQILDIEGDGDMGSNYDLRRTYLDIMAFQMLAKNNKYLQAITEYLSFDMTEEVSKIPIPFDPFGGQDRSVIEEWWIKYGFGEAKTNFPTKNTESEIENLSEGVLQNSELEVSTVKFGSLDERKDSKTLKEALIEILKHSSASAAAVTEVATEGALDRVVDAAGIAQKLASFLMRRDIRESLGIGDLDNWISSAEKGYTDNLESESLRFPESNSLEPYGRPATQNPTIREIDTKDTKAD